MTRLAPILVSLLAFAAASCGGGDDGGDAPSRQEFAERADDVCRQAVRSLEKVAQDADTPQDIADAVDRVIEESRDSIDQLSDLERPEGEAGKAAREFVEATRSELEDEAIPALEQLGDAIESRDQQGVREAAARLENLDTGESDRAAREIGAEECAEG